MIGGFFGGLGGRGWHMGILRGGILEGGNLGLGIGIEGRGI